MSRRLLLLALLLAGTCLAANVTGAWNFAVELDAGSGNPKFTFKQDGEKLTGTYEGLLGKIDLAGTVKGNAIEFSFTASGQGQSAKVLYKGAIESDSRMKGTAEYGEFGKGTWTATKAQ